VTKNVPSVTKNKKANLGSTPSSVDKGAPSKYAPKTYAEAAKSKAKKISFFTPRERKTPQIFKRICFDYFSDPSVRRQGYRGVLKSVFDELHEMKIRHLVKEVSLIGLSVVELYVAEICFDKVMAALNNQKAHVCTEISRVITNVDSRKFVANRIGFLLKRTSISKLRECILEGFDPETLALCLEMEKSFRKKSAYSNGTQQHQGKSRSNDDSTRSATNGSCL
jgi:hypothetical protein